jgi:hypothetical protein
MVPAVNLLVTFEGNRTREKILPTFVKLVRDGTTPAVHASVPEGVSIMISWRRKRPN